MPGGDPPVGISCVNHHPLSHTTTGQRTAPRRTVGRLSSPACATPWSHPRALHLVDRTVDDAGDRRPVTVDSYRSEGDASDGVVIHSGT